MAIVCCTTAAGCTDQPWAQAGRLCSDGGPCICASPKTLVQGGLESGGWDAVPLGKSGESDAAPRGIGLLSLFDIASLLLSTIVVKSWQQEKDSYLSEQW